MVYITHDYLLEHPQYVFVFGDNALRKGYGGAAKFRNHPNTYGFITKKAPNNNDGSFYTPEEYWPVYQREIQAFRQHYEEHPEVEKYLVSPIGGGLANQYGIFEQIVHPNLRKDLSDLDRIVYLF